MNWHKGVYKPKDKTWDPKNEEWRKTRLAVLERDKFTCLRCEKKYKTGNHLSVHHMVPRSAGGSNDMSNLITLCNKCHDFVEVEELRTIADILGSYSQGNAENKDVAPVIEREETFDRPEWHKYVYGGVKRPSEQSGD